MANTVAQSAFSVAGAHATPVTRKQLQARTSLSVTSRSAFLKGSLKRSAQIRSKTPVGPTCVLANDSKAEVEDDADDSAKQVREHEVSMNIAAYVRGPPTGDTILNQPIRPVPPPGGICVVGLAVLLPACTTGNLSRLTAAPVGKLHRPFGVGRAQDHPEDVGQTVRVWLYLGHRVGGYPQGFVRGHSANYFREEERAGMDARFPSQGIPQVAHHEGAQVV
eukprot:1724786-Pyramimonas_sp.AAC.2